MPLADCASLSRREVRRRDRRDVILSVAAKSFLERGYAGTTMSAIAATLGGSKGTLWSYFPSKQELFAAVLDHATKAYRARLSEILDPTGDVESTLRRFCRSLMEKVTSPDSLELHRLIVAEAARFPEVGKIFYDRGPGMTHEKLSDFLAGAMIRGQIRRDDARNAARALIALTLSRVHLQRMTGYIHKMTAGEKEADIDLAVAVFMRAYSID